MNDIIVTPKNVSISAYEFGAIWEVKARDHRLYYPDVNCVVPFNAELIVEFVEGSQPVADAFAAKLTACGYTDVTTEMVAQANTVGGSD